MFKRIVYVADDGTEFLYKDQCLQYEIEQLRKPMKKEFIKILEKEIAQTAKQDAENIIKRNEVVEND